MAKGGTSTDIEIKINDNPELQSYYQSPESRIGYRLVLGGTRHFGYWDKETSRRTFSKLMSSSPLDLFPLAQRAFSLRFSRFERNRPLCPTGNRHAHPEHEN